MSSQAEADPTLANLVRWLEQGGALLSRLQVISLGGGERGLFAAADLAPRETLMRIPRRHLVTLEDAQASDIGRALDAHARVDEKTMYLSAFLLQEKEKGEGSFWKPLLDVLPKAFPTHPFFFQEQELSFLKGSFLLELVALQRNSLASRYERLCQQVPGFDRFGFEAFVWSHFAVVSRTFGSAMNGQQVQCLVPLADMMNDGRPWNTAWGLSEDGSSFELKALSAIPQGTELHTTYGGKSNLHLLLHYGFVHENNVNNEAQFALGIPPDAPLAAEKPRLMGFSDPAERRLFRLSLSYDDSAMAELFAYQRILHAEAEDVARLSAAPDPFARAKGPLSGPTEAKVIPGFVATCQARLAGYETSAEEDDRLLREGSLSHNARNCVLLRRAEKRILQSYAGAYAAMARG